MSFSWPHPSPVISNIKSQDYLNRPRHSRRSDWRPTKFRNNSFISRCHLINKSSWVSQFKRVARFRVITCISLLKMFNVAIVALHPLFMDPQLPQCLRDAIPDGEEHIFLCLTEVPHSLQDHFLQTAPVSFFELVQPIAMFSSLRFFRHILLRLLRHVQLTSEQLVTHAFI